MASIISGCDSDEEVFWGPVTAKEIELLWKYRMSLRKEKESSQLDAKSAEEFTNESSDSGNETDLRGISIAGQLQEVPFLQDNKEDFEENIHYVNNANSELKNALHEKESTLPLTEDNMLYSYPKDNECVMYSGNNFSNEIGFENTEIAVFKNSHDAIKLNHSFCQDVNIVTTSKVNECHPEQSENAVTNEITHVEQDFSSSVCDIDLPSLSIDGKKNSGLNEINELATICNEINASESSYIITKLTNENLSTKMVSSNVEMNRENSINLNYVKTTDNVIHELNGPSVTSGDADSGDCNKKNKNELNLDDRFANIENIPPKQQYEGFTDSNIHVAETKSNLNEVCYFSKAIKPRSSNLNHENVLQERKIENQEEYFMSSEVSLSEQIKVNSAISNVNDDLSNETQFVSPNNEEDELSSSSNNQYIYIDKDLTSSKRLSPLKNKVNEDPHCGIQENILSKVPKFQGTNLKQLSSKPPILKPARLQQCSSLNNDKWVNDLKQKKIPQLKKPDYMVSPAKLNNLLKNCNQLGEKINKIPLVRTETFTKPKTTVSRPKLETAKSISFSPRKKQFEFIKSPISEYIRTGGAISPAKSLPALCTPNKIPVPVSTKQTPVQKLTPKFYSSAEKLIIKPGSSSSIPKLEEKKGKALFPKIFKHQGRIVDGKNPGQISVVTPRAVRTTNLQEASFAILPQSPKQLNISVLEEQ